MYNISQTISQVKWLNDGKTNNLKTISISASWGWGQRWSSKHGFFHHSTTWPGW